MTLLLQISDPHFGTERPPVVEALHRLSRQQRPDVLVLSGDITQRATRAQFSAARRFVDSLAVPRLIAIPGNHDISLFNPIARLFRPYSNYRRFFGNELEPELDQPDLLLLALKTTRRYRHVDGELSPQQIERTAARLRQAGAGQLRVVVTHQPLAVPGPKDRHNLLHRHRQAVECWAAAGADLVLGGHIHLPFVQALHESQAGLARAMWAVQAGTALSTRTRHQIENSVNLIRIVPAANGGNSTVSPGRAASIERWDFQPEAGEFVVFSQHSLQFTDAAPTERGRD